MGTSSTFDKLMMSMGTQRGGALSNTRLQPSSSLVLAPLLGSASDVRGIFADSTTGLEEMRQDKTKKIERVDERAQQGHERVMDKLANTKSKAECDQVQLVQNTDQSLAESFALVTMESEERDHRMT